MDSFNSWLNRWFLVIFTILGAVGFAMWVLSSFRAMQAAQINNALEVSLVKEQSRADVLESRLLSAQAGLFELTHADTLFGWDCGKKKSDGTLMCSAKTVAAPPRVQMVRCVADGCEFVECGEGK